MSDQNAQQNQERLEQILADYNLDVEDVEALRSMVGSNVKEKKKATDEKSSTESDLVSPIRIHTKTEIHNGKQFGGRRGKTSNNGNFRHRSPSQFHRPQFDDKLIENLSEVDDDNTGKCEIRFENLTYDVQVQESQYGADQVAVPTVGAQCMKLIKCPTRLLCLSKPKYATKHILKDLTGVLVPGRLTLLIGPPGSGKSTLMKALSGKIPRNSRLTELKGTMTYNGDVYYANKKMKSCNFVLPKVVGFVPQEDYHAATLSVRETVEFAFNCMSGVNNKDAKVTIDARSRSTSTEQHFANNKTVHGKRYASINNTDEDEDEDDHDVEANVTSGRSISVTSNAQSDEAKIDLALKLLGLNICAETIVGNALLRGVSGGEKKRLTTAEMTAGQVSVLLMDSISIGLDSAATYDICKTLLQCTRAFQANIVVCLLQPPPEVVNLFDDIMVMDAGQIVYHGERTHVLDHFKSMGYFCPPRKDMADFLVEVTTPAGIEYLQQDDEDGQSRRKHLTTDEFVQKYRESSEWKKMEIYIQRQKYLESKKRTAAMNRENQEGIFTFRFNKSANFENVLSSPSSNGVTRVNNSKSVRRRPSLFSVRNPLDMSIAEWLPHQQIEFSNTWLTSYLLCLGRQAKITLRDKVFLRGRFGQVLLMGILAGTMFYKLDKDDITDIVGLLFFSCVYIALGNLATIPVVFEQRSVFYKHRDANFFPTSAYVSAQMSIQIPQQILETLIFSCFVYFLSGLCTANHGLYFGIFILISFAATLAIGQYCRLLAHIVPSMPQAQPLAALSVLLFTVFSGLTISYPDIPNYWHWLYWINPLSWGLRSMTINELTSPTPDYSNSTLCLTNDLEEALLYWQANTNITQLIPKLVECYEEPMTKHFNQIFKYLKLPPILSNVTADPNEVCVYWDKLPLNEQDKIEYCLDENGASVVVDAIDACKTFGECALSQFGFESDRMWIWYGVFYLLGLWLFLLMCTTLAMENLRFNAGGTQMTEAQDESLSKNKKKKRLLRQIFYENNDEDTDDEIEEVIDDSDKHKSQLSTPLLSSTGAKNDNEFFSPDFARVSLAFQDLWYSVEVPSKNGGGIYRSASFARKERVDLLKGVTGYALPGTMTALMGSSGAGKTTLLDVLAGRKNTGSIDGSIMVNGKPKDQKIFNRIMGYVEQMDVHSLHSTVKEALEFSAILRLPYESVTEAQRNQYVQSILRMLELESIQNKEIGEDQNNGLLMGERKRVTIGVELVANPSVLFLDEPTTGLDARSAIVVMRTVQRIASTGRSVICTIHQPSTAIFELFDMLLLLRRGGKTVYFGPLGNESSKLIKYLQNIQGTPPIQPGVNPANWMLECIGAGINPGNSNDGPAFDYATVYSEGELCEQNEAKVNQMKSIEVEGSQNGSITSDLSYLEKSKYAAPIHVQFWACLGKATINYWRSPNYNFTRMAVSVFVALVFGSVFHGQSYDTEATLFGRLGLFYLSTSFVGVVNMMSVMPVMTKERAAFYREQSSNMYNITVYGMCYGLVELPYIFLSTGLFINVFYWFVGLAAIPPINHFIWYWVFFALYITCTVFIGQFLICLLPNQQTAQVMGSAVSAIMNLFAGYLCSPKSMPWFWKWMYYIVPTHYAFEGLVESQFYDDKTLVQTLQGHKEPANQFVNSLLTFSDDHIERNFLILLGIIFALRFLTFFTLHHVRHISR